MAYFDQSGAARGEGGQFAALPGASLSDQIGAGVDRYDTAESAAAKVALRRMATGLDPHTGHARPSAAASDGGEGLLGEALWGLCKWVLFPAAAILVPLFAAWSAIDSAEARYAKGMAGGGLGRFAAAYAFSGESLSPASRYASMRIPAAKFYACELDRHCAAFGDADPLRVATMLVQLAKAGDEAAARDLCLMPLLVGSSDGSIEQARSHCAWALRARPDSAEARRINATLNGSPWMSLAALGQRVRSAFR